jgi:hypothetical protein
LLFLFPCFLFQNMNIYKSEQKFNLNKF